MKSSGLTSAFGGNLAIMDIYAAQKMFGRGRTFDRIDLAVKDGRTLTDAEQELTAHARPRLPGRAAVGPRPAVRGDARRLFDDGRHLEPVRALHRDVHHLQLVRDRGDAAAIGDRHPARARRDARPDSLAVSRRERGHRPDRIARRPGVRHPDRARHRRVDRRADRRRLRRRAARRRAVDQPRRCSLLALAIGIGTSIVAAAIPARSAARVDPVQALQKGKYQVLSAGESRLRAVLGARCSARCRSSASASAARGRSSTPATSLAIVVALLLSPLLSLALAKALRPLLKWLRPVEGALAADSLIQAPRRTSASVAALMLSLALVVAFAGMARASYASIIDWMETALNPDLFVMPSQSIVVRTIRFPATMGPELAAIPGVERVQMVRDARIMFRKTPVMIVAVEVNSIARDRAAARRSPATPTRCTAAPRPARG